MKKEEITVGDENMLDVFEEKESNKHNYSPEFYNLILNSIEALSLNKPTEAVMYGEDETHYLLDANYKDVIRVPKLLSEKRILSNVAIGESINVLIKGISDENNQYSIDGSVADLYKDKAFNILKNIEDNEFVNVRIVELTPGGYNCKILMERCDLDAFLPQILAGVNKLHDDAKLDLVGQTYNMCVESFARDKGTWIVSRRKYLKQLIPSAIQELEKTHLYSGYVTGTAPFGVFVQFNECLTGMIHFSNLDESMLEKFNEKNIPAGTKIEFYVKEIIKKDKIILTQNLTESLWDKIEMKDVLTGTVKEHKPFGTLMVLDSDTLGLIHVSEQTSSVKNSIPGDEIEVKIIALDREQRNIFLSVV